MARKAITVEKLTYNEVQGLIQSLPMMKYETYQDNMEFNRVNKLLQDEVAAFNEKQAEIFTKNGAIEKEGALLFDDKTPQSVLMKVTKEVNELSSQPSKLEKKDVEIMDEDGYNFAIKTREPIPALNSAILAQFVVRVIEEKISG